jgi:hypothetical protein
LGAGAKVLAVEFVEARKAQAQFLGSRSRTKVSLTMAVENMTDDGSRLSFDQL